MNNKFVRIPVASHGLHPDDYNFPYANTFNFMDVCPCYIKPLYKGEKDSVKLGVFSRLNPTVNPAFATGRYNFKAFFVPFKYVFRPYYYAMEGTEYYFKDQSHTHGTIKSMPYITMGDLSTAFLSAGLVQAPQGTVDPNDPNTYDLLFRADPGALPQYFDFTVVGTRVLKILGALGYSPSWIGDDSTQVNVLPILSYIRIFADYYFPKQYVGNVEYDKLIDCVQSEDIVRNALTLVNALVICSQGFFDDSFLTCAFDNPVGPNTGVVDVPIGIHDPTNVYPFTTSSASNANTVIGQEVNTSANSNGTPSVQSEFVNSSGNQTGATAYRINQWILDTLQSINNFVKRHQLAGGRLLDRILASRGVKLDHDYVEMPFFLGEKNVEIEISAVENNTSNQLGDLAGKGVASTEPGKPLEFSCNADDDGIFFVVAYVKPDFAMPIYNDPWNFQVSVLDFYHSELDKIGPSAIPQACVVNYFDARVNQILINRMFGFLNQYYSERAGRPRLLGDFRVSTRGAQSLNSYHTFRLFPMVMVAQNGVNHSYNFLSAADSSQFQRLFYSDSVDNLQLFIRITGHSEKYKLPLGDSYDWDDDEFNKKVTLLQSGNID